MAENHSSRFNWRPLVNWRLELSWKNKYDLAFFVLFIVDGFLRLLWLDKPNGSLIFDEWYYVNVARVILGLPQSVGSNGQTPYGNAPIGLDPNHEHPPLAKLLIALSTYLLGNNGYGWRIPSVIFGMLGVLVFYLLMKKVAKNDIVPLLSTFLFSFDNLVFVQSRIGILDIFTLTFMIIGLYWYFSGHTYLSALGMTLSTLTKMTGAAGFAIIVVLHASKYVSSHSKPMSWDPLLSWFEKYFATYLVSFAVILTILDHFWTPYPTAYQHMQYILQYSSSLTSACPNGIISCPWQWLVNQVEIPYLTVNVGVTAGKTVTNYTSVSFRGVMTPAILLLTIPAMGYSAYSYYKTRADLPLLSLVWFAVTYLPYFPAVLVLHRVTYLFYFLLAIPSVCAAIAYMIFDTKPPKIVVLIYLIVVVYSFFMMFPFNFQHPPT